MKHVEDGTMPNKFMWEEKKTVSLYLSYHLYSLPLTDNMFPDTLFSELSIETWTHLNQLFNY